MGVCQWSGVAIVMASTSFCSRMARKSLSVAGGSPISCLARSANFPRIVVSTSQTCEMRAALRLERREMGIAASIQTDHSKVEAIVGAEDLAVTLCRRSNGQACCAQRQCIEKLTSCNHHFPRGGRL